MTSQLAMFPTGPLARRDDPPTSRQAPSTAVLSELQQRVIETHEANKWGLTDDELCRLLPDVRPGTLVKRRGECVRAGRLENSGRTRRILDTGREGIIWRTVTDG